MLTHCRAYSIAPTMAASRTLEMLASRSGFGVVHSAFEPGVTQDEPTPVTYFFVHFHLSDPAMQQVIGQVRDNPAGSMRYSPIILIIDDCPVEVLLKYIEFGFDDVISLPENREVLEARLTAQLNTEHLYVQTANYLGPDRRRMEFPDHSDERRVGVSPHMRLIIRRDPRLGTSVLHRQVVGQTIRRAPDAGTTFLPRPPGWYLTQ